MGAAASLLFWALLAPGPPQEDAPPSRELVTKTVAELEQALSTGTKEEKARALERASEVVAPAVVAAVAAGLRDDDAEVVQAALEALRWMDHDDALRVLHRAYRSDRRIKKDVGLQASLLRAIGQHADPASIEVLSHKPFDTKNRDVIRARIRGLGRIRARASIEVLLGMMRGASARDVEAYMGDFRVSLMILTGTDQGPAADPWQRWWKSHGKDFEMTPERPPLPRNVLEDWIRYWGLDENYGRARRREDRGD